MPARSVAGRSSFIFADMKEKFPRKISPAIALVTLSIVTLINLWYNVDILGRTGIIILALLSIISITFAIMLAVLPYVTFEGQTIIVRKSVFKKTVFEITPDSRLTLVIKIITITGPAKSGLIEMRLMDFAAWESLIDRMRTRFHLVTAEEQSTSL